MNEAVQILFPVGRLISGSLYEGIDKDDDGKPFVNRNSQPYKKYNFGVAIPKGAEQHWAHTEWGAKIWAAAHTAWPNGQAQQPDFSWKVKDGDSTVLNKGNPPSRPCDKEGWPGHWVVFFGSTFAPKIYAADGSVNPSLEIAGAVKCGYYLQVAGSVKSNESTKKPGVYLNHDMVAFAGYGAVISKGADPKSVGFGKGPTPAGMTTVPPSGGMTLPAAAPAPVAPRPIAPAPAPVVVPQTAVAPMPGFLSPGVPGVPAAPVVAPPPSVPTTPRLSAKAAGATYEQLVAVGWTPALLQEHGYLA